MVKKESFPGNINIKVGRPSKSMREYIRGEKAEGKVNEAKADWKLVMNRPSEIKKRKNSFLSHIEDYIENLGSENAKKNFEIFKNYSSEEAKKKLADFGYNPEIGGKALEEYISERFQEIDELKFIKNEKRIFTQEGLNLFYVVLNKAYPEDMNYLMSVDGASKTILSKLRDKAAPKR